MKIHARLISRIVLAVSVMGISFVSGQAIAAFPSAPYFPLAVNTNWTYDVDSGAGTATVTRNSTTTNITCNSVAASTIRLDTSSTIPAPMNGSRSYNTSDGNGIRLHQKYSPNQLVQGTPRNVTVTFCPPVVLADGTTDVGQPASITSGTATLQIATVTCPLPYTEPQPFTVNSIGGFDVQAGHFDNVLNISGSVRITGTCNGTAVDQTLAFTLYLAQNIGPVKSVSTTTDNLTSVVIDTSTSELTGSNLLLPNVTPSPWDYGNVGYPGGTSDKTFTIQNSGPATLNGSSALSGDADFSFQGGGGAFSLGSGASTTVTVRFAPSSLGAKSATLRVSSTDYPGATPKDVSLSGTGADHTLAITVGPSGSPDPVASGGPVSLGVTANDSFSHPLTYAWLVTGCTGGLGAGSFNNASAQNPIWTAPANTTGSQQSCTIQATVSDGILPAVLGSYSQEVNAVPPHTLAITIGPSGSPNPVASSGTANLTVTASDSLAHTLFYAWAVTGCTGGLGTGSFNNAASRTPIWTAPANMTGSPQSCTIQVTVNDGAVSDPKSTFAEFTQTVNALAHTLAITIGPSGSPDPVASGGPVSLGVTANDSFGHGLTYAWSVTGCTGGLGTGSFNNASAQTPTWTAPANTTGSQQSCTIQATVSDGILPAVLGSYSQEVNAVPPHTLLHPHRHQRRRRIRQCDQ